mgnify:CR=1 FL=1
MAYLNRRSLMVKFVAAFAVTNFAKSLILSAKAEVKPKDHQIDIKRLKFTVKQLEVKVGDTVTWTNLDISPHTATASDKSWDTGRLKKGERKTITITNDFSPKYYCRFHPNMKASLKLVS